MPSIAGAFSDGLLSGSGIVRASVSDGSKADMAAALNGDAVWSCGHAAPLPEPEETFRYHQNEQTAARMRATTRVTAAFYSGSCYGGGSVADVATVNRNEGAINTNRAP